MLDPAGRVVMISGANRGIGRAVAQCLLDKGYSLSLGARSPSGLAEGFEGPEDRLIAEAYEAEDPEAPARWVQATLQRYGRIDALVNNAGIYRATTLFDEDEAPLDEMWRINVKGPLRMIRAAYPHLKASGAGRVINVASLSGKRVVGDAIGYTMSKHAAVALTHQVRRSGWDDNVRACAICPSFVKSDMAAGITDMPTEKMIQPGDLSELIATVIALPNSASVAELTVQWDYEIMF